MPAHLPAKESGWYLLCADCYRAVLDREPPHQSAVREWKMGRRKVEVGCVRPIRSLVPFLR